MLCEARDSIREIENTLTPIRESQSLTQLHENLHKTLEAVLEQIDILRDILTLNSLRK
jgi:hypothetical protein